MDFMDVFSGWGGFHLGMEQSGHKCVGWCERDKFAQKLYRAYFNVEGLYFEADATKINTGELPDFDILCGGFPCQAFSVGGKRQGLNDARGTLFFELARILQDKRPRYFIFENVKGLLAHNDRKTFITITQVLTDIGYTVEWQVLYSIYYGVPQERERLFICGYLGKRGIKSILPIRKNQRVHQKTGEGSWKKTMATVTTRSLKSRQIPDVTCIITKKGWRDLTPLECFRLQGFPDDIVAKAREMGISDTQLYKGAGNAVSVPVIKELGQRIKELEREVSG